MAKIKFQYETMYDRGDVVIFQKNDRLLIGVITAYYYDCDSVWYNIAVGKEFTYTYANCGDIGEHDIVAKIEDESIKDKVTEYVKAIEF